MGAEVRLYAHDVVIRGGQKLYGCRDAEPSEILSAALPLVRKVLASDELAFAVADELRIGGSAIAAVLAVLEAATKGDGT